MANISQAFGTIEIVGNKDRVQELIYLTAKYMGDLAYHTTIALRDNLQFPENTNESESIDTIGYERFMELAKDSINRDYIILTDLIANNSNHWFTTSGILENRIEDEKDLVWYRCSFYGDGRWVYMRNVETFMNSLCRMVADNINDISDKIKKTKNNDDNTAGTDIGKDLEHLNKQRKIAEDDLKISNRLSYSLDQNRQYKSIIEPDVEYQTYVLFDYVDYEPGMEVFYQARQILDVYYNEVIGEDIEDIPYTRENIVYKYECENEYEFFDETKESVDFFYDAYFNNDRGQFEKLMFINFLPDKSKIIKKLKSVTRNGFNGICWDSATGFIEEEFNNNKEEFKFIPKQIRQRFEIDTVDVQEEPVDKTAEIIERIVVNPYIIPNTEKVQEILNNVDMEIKKKTIKVIGKNKNEFDIVYYHIDDNNSKFSYKTINELVTEFTLNWDGKSKNILELIGKDNYFYLRNIASDIVRTSEKGNEDIKWWRGRYINSDLTALQRYVIAEDMSNKNKNKKPEQQA